MENLKKTRSLNTQSSRTESDRSSQYSTDTIKGNHGRTKRPHDYLKGTTSSAYNVDTQNENFQTSFTSEVGSEIPSSDQSDKSTSAEHDFTNKATSSVYTVDMQNESFLTPFTTKMSSEIPSSDKSSRNNSILSPKQNRNNNIQLMPFKMKDAMEIIKDNPAYKDKSPVKLKLKENDIDQIIENQNIQIGEAIKLPEEYFTKSIRESPVSLGSSLNDKSAIMNQSIGVESANFSQKSSKLSKKSDQSMHDGSVNLSKKFYKESKESASKPTAKEPLFGGVNRNENVFAMTDIQAFPVMGGNIRPSRGKSRRHNGYRTPIRSKNRSRRRNASRTPRRSKSRSRRKVRSRSRRRQPERLISRPRRVVRRPIHRRRISPCTPFPLCDNERCPLPRPVHSRSRPLPTLPPPEARPFYSQDYFVSNRPFYANETNYPSCRPIHSTSMPRTLPPTNVHGATSLVCSCNVGENKLQFIQPGLCSKKKKIWTNEYAILPKAQVNLIDPCDELNSPIYPRADNPCIRDGRGNPLTDCIGRPLRSSFGKNFLRFTANGSIMDTSLTGNFWTGQPPLCVKCPMPSSSCAPDTTHNWWMSCGYPVMSNMDPFYKRVVAAETSLLT